LLFENQHATTGKKKTKATRSICTSSQEMLKSYKIKEPTPYLQQLEGEKEIPII
jgi:hypothetical protein